MKAQVTLTPSEAKRLIARAVAQMPEVQEAMKKGRVLFKAGSTVSAVVEELVGQPQRISGRVSRNGTKESKDREGGGLHKAYLDKGKLCSFDEDSMGVWCGLGKGDVVITGANAIDVNRRAAVMIGIPLPTTAHLLPAIRANGAAIIVAIGWEKLIPGTIEQAIATAGRQSMDLSMGMAVGLVPIDGTVVTETDALSMLAGVKATVIGAGGINGAEGATTIVLEGEAESLQKAWEMVQSVKGAALSGVPDSFAECEAGNAKCSAYVNTRGGRTPLHQSCVYRDKNAVKKLAARSSAKK